jgi:dimethylargininase
MVHARHALIRRPSPLLADGIVTHIERSAHVDVELAHRQWDAYVDALHDAGWTTHEVPAAPDCPDSGFVEDTMVVYGDLAVIGRMGAEERWPELMGAADTVCELGYRMAHIEAPGTLDGGDVLKHGGTVWVGRSGRTNDEGVTQLRAQLEPFGAKVVAVPLTKALHLKSAVTALPDGSLLGLPDLLGDAPPPGIRVPPEEAGAHVVPLGGDAVLIAASAPRTAELVTELGFRPVPVEIGEFEKLEGCVTCLSVLVPDR